MIDLVIFILKYTFLAFIYIFLFWLLLLIGKDLRKGGTVKPAASRRRARLVLQSGPGIDEPRSFIVRDEITIGRGDRNTVLLDDEAASDEHARLYFSNNGRFVIEDLGSTNGTFIDNQIVVGPTPLHSGSAIKIGRSLMVFMER